MSRPKPERKKTQKTVRLEDDLIDAITERGDFTNGVRAAVIQWLEVGLSEEAIILKGLRDMDRKVEKLTIQLEAHQMLFSYFLRYFFVYAPKIPEEAKGAAMADGMDRYAAFKDSFRKSLEKEDSGLLFSLIAQFVEEMQTKDVSGENDPAHDKLAASKNGATPR